MLTKYLGLFAVLVLVLLATSAHAKEDEFSSELIDEEDAMNTDDQAENDGAIEAPNCQAYTRAPEYKEIFSASYSYSQLAQVNPKAYTDQKACKVFKDDAKQDAPMMNACTASAGGTFAGAGSKLDNETFFYAKGLVAGIIAGWPSQYGNCKSPIDAAQRRIKYELSRSLFTRKYLSGGVDLYNVGTNPSTLLDYAYQASYGLKRNEPACIGWANHLKKQQAKWDADKVKLAPSTQHWFRMANFACTAYGGKASYKANYDRAFFYGLAISSQP